MMLSGEWVLEKHNQQLLSKYIEAPTLLIDTQNQKISGNAGCNLYNAGIEKITDSQLAFSAIATTMRFCDEKNMESTFLSALEKVGTYKIEQNTLIFYNQNNQPLLTFKKKEIRTSDRLHDIWSVIAMNGKNIQEVENRPFLEINLATKRITGSDSCNSFFGSLAKITDTEMVVGDDVGSTRKMCAEMELADAFLKVLPQIRKYRLDGLFLRLYDDDGKEVVTLLKVD